MDNNELNNNLENNNVNMQNNTLDNSAPINNVQNNVLDNSTPINNVQNNTLDNNVPIDNVQNNTLDNNVPINNVPINNVQSNVVENDNIFSDNTNSFTQPNNLKDKLTYQNNTDTDTYPKEEEKKEVIVKKSSKGPKILIFFLILVILGLGGFIVYDKFIGEIPINKQTKEEKNKLKEVTDMTLIEELRSELSASTTSGLVDGMYYNKQISSSDINSKELLKFNILKYVVDNNININETKKTIDTGVQQDIKAIIPKADITKYMQNNYNTDLDYAYKVDKQYGVVDYIGYRVILADDTNYYIASVPGGDGSYYLDTKFVKAQEDDNYLYIYDKAVYTTEVLDFVYSHDTIYSDNSNNSDDSLVNCEGEKNNSVGNIKKSDKCPFTGKMETLTHEYVSKYIFDNMSDKLKTYKHIFKKVDGNYYWVSSQVVNE